MLKPYQQRVEGTYAFMLSNLEYAQENKVKIKMLRKKFKDEVITQLKFPLRWEIDTTRSVDLSFKGYEASYQKSTISENKRLYYDKERPFERPVKHYNRYEVATSVTKPYAYVIPQGWYDIVERLKLNSVDMSEVTRDTTIALETYHIEDFSTFERPYEGHYLHYNTKVSSKVEQVKVRKGDYIVICNQVANRYIIETLEPEATDSFFNWNFFDIILQQKEHFSSYVFEETAAKLLSENEQLRADLKKAIMQNSEMEKDQQALLEFIYERSDYREPEYLRYPIFRVRERADLRGFE